MQPHYRLQFDAQALLRDHPPFFRNPNKALLFELAYPDRLPSAATVEVTRWPGQPMDEPIVFWPMTADLRPDYFDYQPAGDPQTTLEWHVNFADPKLFFGYSSALFAQDEMQVAEHPLLASVRQALLAKRLEALTADRSGPTPILVRNVERRLAIATHPDASAGRPRGLYGNHFVTASADTIRKASRRIDPPAFSNIIAMAAPAGGFGAYTVRQIEDIFLTAYTAFAAATRESTQHEDSSRHTLIHSGFWGCGAFGGNRLLMIAVQTLAARAASVSRLIFHTAGVTGTESARQALQIADQLVRTCGGNGKSPAESNLHELTQAISRLGLRWGMSDGT